MLKLNGLRDQSKELRVDGKTVSSGGWGNFKIGGDLSPRVGLRVLGSVIGRDAGSGKTGDDLHPDSSQTGTSGGCALSFACMLVGNEKHRTNPDRRIDRYFRQ